MNSSKRNYRATFILDSRGKEESVETMIEDLKKEIAAVSGEVTEVENLGKRDFARVVNKEFPAGVYVRMGFSGPGESPALIKERLRLNQTVSRTFIETV